MIYKERRARLLAELPSQSVTVLYGAEQLYRNHDTEHRFRQNSDFLYLTGLTDPGLILVLIKTEQQTSSVLFAPPFDEQYLTWMGPRVTPEQAINEFEFEQAYPLDEFESSLSEFLIGFDTIVSMWEQSALHGQITKKISTLRQDARKGEILPTSWLDLAPILHELRVKKSPQEIEQLTHVIEMSAQGHKQLMKRVKDCSHEYQLEAILSYEYKRQGALEFAYPPIVATGQNACILHYHQNQAEIEKGDLILVDAGAEWHGYAADITRTFPASGRFTADQKALYELVLASQMAGIDACQVGQTYDSIQAAILHTMIPGLLDLGILSGKPADIMESKAYRSVYMHGAGHFLGLDVHDRGSYHHDEQWRPLQAGMVLTVEPGIYIRKGHPDIEAKWHGMGIRIEDDILITENGPTVLSASAPKSVADIEACYVP